MGQRMSFDAASNPLESSLLQIMRSSCECTTRQKKVSYLNSLTSSRCEHNRCIYPDLKLPIPVYMGEDISKSNNVRQHRLSRKFLRSAWPNLNPPPMLTTMNVEETSIWVLMLAGCKDWKEAIRYSEIFGHNKISGYMLPFLTNEILKSFFGIKKLGHRLEIMTAIENNELTLMNPVIMSLNPYIFFKYFNKSMIRSSEKHTMRRIEERKLKMHSKEVAKWFSNVSTKPSCISGRREVSCSTEYDHNTNGSRRVNDLYSGTEDCLTKYGSVSKCFWSPEVKLSSSAKDHLEQKSLDTKSGTWSSEHSSRFSLSNKVRNISPCVEMNNCWDSLEDADVVAR